MPSRRIYLSLGSNIGDRESNLRKAVRSLEERLGKASGLSSLYETEPWGYKNQPSFLNMCACFDSNIEPEDLLDLISSIESALGRQRTFRWGPRTVDIDILMMGDVSIDGEALTIPHPRMWERAFVVVPLAEIAPNLKAPDGMSAALKAVTLDPDGKIKPMGGI